MAKGDQDDEGCDQGDEEAEGGELDHLGERLGRWGHLGSVVTGGDGVGIVGTRICDSICNEKPSSHKFEKIQK